MSTPGSMIMLLNSLEREIIAGDLKHEATSGWSIYQHIEHVLLVNAQIMDMIEKNEEPSTIKPRTIIGYIALWLSFIPRGKGRSPEHVKPQMISKGALIDLLNKVTLRYEILNLHDTHTSQKVVGNHPVFGGLNALEWFRFSIIHTRHHLKIIDDIR